MSNIKTPYEKRCPPSVVGVKLVTRNSIGKIHKIVGIKAKAYSDAVALERKTLLTKARTGDPEAIAKLKAVYGLTVIVPIAGPGS